MALDTQILAVQLRGGVDTKTAEKAVVAAKLLSLENGSFTAPGAIRKRNGFNRVLSRSVVGSTTPIGAGQGLVTYRDELLLADPSSLYSYNASLDAWVNKGGLVSANVTQRNIIRNTQNQSAQDSAVHASGLQVFAWEDSQGGVRYSVIDSATGLAIVPDALVDASGSRPKCLALGAYLVVLWVNGGSLYYAPIVVASPQTLGTPVLVTNALAGSTSYDAEIIGSRLFVAWATSTGISVSYLGSSLSAATPISIATPTPSALCVFADSMVQNVVVAWSAGGTGVSFQVRDYGLANVVAGVISAVTPANVVNMTGVSVPGASSSFRIFYSLSDATPSNYRTRIVTVTGYASVASADFLRSVSLAGKAFVYQGVPYVPLAYQSTLQSSYFVADASGNLVAKLLPGLGGGIPTRSVLPESNALADPSQFQFSFLAKDLLTVTGGAVATLTGVSSVTLDFFDPMRSYQSAELGAGLHISGGFLSLYDGAGVVEHGFHLYPEGVATALTDADVGTAQSYQYVAVYAWTDNQGQIHRSAPSPAVTQKKASLIDGTHRVTVTIPTLRLTAKQSARRRVMVEVYRTTANNPLLYLTTSITAPLYNDTAADTVTLTDSVTDATLLGNLPLYTTGEIENIAPGPISSMAVHQGRIVALDPTNPLQLWWSKPVVPGSPVEFSDLFVQNIDPVGGDVTAVCRMDGWLVIFKETAILATNEEGPPASGAGYVFTSGQQIPSDVGCINPRSVNLGGNGITFQSAKGWHLLSRSLQVLDQPDTDQWANDTATSALTMPGAHETRYTLASGTALVHDDFGDQWGTFTNVAAVDSTIWQGLHTYLRLDGQVRQETPGVFYDAGMPIKLRLKTSWLQFAGVSGFQRLRRMLVLGDYISPHTLLCSVAYDFNPEPSQVFTIDATGLLDQPVYGGDSVYGGASAATDSLVYGGTFPAYAWRLGFERQKCSAIQITLEDSQAQGEGCSFAAISFEAGVKRGLRKSSLGGSSGTSGSDGTTASGGSLDGVMG